MLPLVFDEAAWRVPATPDDVADAASFLLASCESDTSDARTAAVTRLLAAYAYTRAELVLAMRELPRYAKASHRFGRGLNIADVAEIIDENRRLRASIAKGGLSEAQVSRLLEITPNLSADAFGVVGHGEHGARYAITAVAREALGLPALPPRQELLLAYNPQDPTARVPLGLRAHRDVDEPAADAPALPAPPSATIHRLPPREGA